MRGIITLKLFKPFLRIYSNVNLLARTPEHITVFTII